MILNLFKFIIIYCVILGCTPTRINEIDNIIDDDIQCIPLTDISKSQFELTSSLNVDQVNVTYSDTYNIDIKGDRGEYYIIEMCQVIFNEKHCINPPVKTYSSNINYYNLLSNFNVKKEESTTPITFSIQACRDSSLVEGAKSSSTICSKPLRKSIVVANISKYISNTQGLSSKIEKINQDITKKSEELYDHIVKYNDILVKENPLWKVVPTLSKSIYVQSIIEFGDDVFVNISKGNVSNNRSNSTSFNLHKSAMCSPETIPWPSPKPQENDENNDDQNNDDQNKDDQNNDDQNKDDQNNDDQNKDDQNKDDQNNDDQNKDDQNKDDQNKDDQSNDINKKTTYYRVGGAALGVGLLNLTTLTYSNKDSFKEKMIQTLDIKNLLRNKEQLKVVAEKASDPTEKSLAQNTSNKLALEAANQQVLSDIDQLRVNTFNKWLFNLDRNEIVKLESFFAQLEKAVSDPENEKMPRSDDLPKTKVDLEEFDEILEKYNQYIEVRKSEMSSNRITLSELQNNKPLSVKNSLPNTVQAPANKFKSKFSRKTKFAFSILNIALGSFFISKANSLQLTNNPILTKLEELENKIKNLLEQRKNILLSS